MAQKSAAGGRILIQFVSQLCYRNTKKKHLCVAGANYSFLPYKYAAETQKKKHLCVAEANY